MGLGRFSQNIVSSKENWARLLKYWIFLIHRFMSYIYAFNAITGKWMGKITQGCVQGIAAVGSYVYERMKRKKEINLYSRLTIKASVSTKNRPIDNRAPRQQNES